MAEWIVRGFEGFLMVMNLRTTSDYFNFTASSSTLPTSIKVPLKANETQGFLQYPWQNKLPFWTQEKILARNTPFLLKKKKVREKDRQFQADQNIS